MIAYHYTVHPERHTWREFLAYGYQSQTPEDVATLRGRQYPCCRWWPAPLGPLQHLWQVSADLVGLTAVDVAR